MEMGDWGSIGKNVRSVRARRQEMGRMGLHERGRDDHRAR